MKIQFRTLPVPQRLHGWRRLASHAKNLLRGNLIVDFGRLTLELAH